MTIQIVAATIHQLKKLPKTQGPDSVTLKARDSILPVNSQLNNLCQNLISLYSDKANSNGTLGVDPVVHQFHTYLQNYISDTTDFLTFSRFTVARIATEMSEANFSSGGFALFLRYKIDGQDFLFVAMLKLKNLPGINTETLDITENLNIDLQHLHEAARVNITRWVGKEQPYLTFIKGRSDRVSDYFRDALACTSYTDSKHHTQELLRAAFNFVHDRSDLDEKQKASEVADVRRRLFECFESNRVEVALTTLAVAISPQAPEDFITYVRDNQSSPTSYNLDHRFKPDRRAYMGLQRVTGKIGTITLAFDVQDVQEERVRYDSALNAIVIAAPSADLISSIQENAKQA